MGTSIVKGVDDAAAVVDEHTGKVIAQFTGLGSVADAHSHARICRSGGVEHYSSTKVITGDEARKAMKNGRV